MFYTTLSVGTSSQGIQSLSSPNPAVQKSAKQELSKSPISKVALINYYVCIRVNMEGPKDGAVNALDTAQIPVEAC